MNLLNLFVKIGVDDQASENLSGISSKIGSGLKTAAKIGTAAVTAAAGAISFLTKKSLDGYAEYEQLVGGVETLFKQSADQVIEYANRAYETAGLSANEYMDTVTSFSASLLQGLGGDTEKAAEVANQAVIDMADNANKMGTSMEMIQNAYQGFDKRNYTMLDNLKLGYGGTASEMARLINDSGVLGDTVKVTADTVNNVSFDKIIEAIHTVQDRMGITGTTAEEAASTIEGSVNMMKASWSNLVTGIADDNADLDQLIENFTYSFSKAAENILPRLEQILTGFGDFVVKIAPVITDQLPELVQSILPALVDSATALLQALVDAAPQIVSVLAEMAPSIISSILTMLPQITQAGIDLIVALAGGIADALPELVPIITDVILSIVEILTEPDNLVKLIDAAFEIIAALTEGIFNALPDLITRIPDIMIGISQAFLDAIPAIIDGLGDVGVAMIEGVWNGITSVGDWFGQKVSDFFGGIVDTVKSTLGIHSPSKVFAGIGSNMALGLGEGWDNKFGGIKRGITDGMDFGTANIDFGSSGVAAIGNSVASGISALAGTGGGQIVIDFTAELDGAIIARKMVPYNNAEAVRSGA